MSAEVHSYTRDELERRRSELRKHINDPEFQDRIAQGALLDRELDLVAELEDLDYLASHAGSAA